MDRQRYITVPLTVEAKKGYDCGEEITDQTLTWQLTEIEFNNLYNSGVFDLINIECDLMIDDFESDWIEGDKIEIALNILQDWENKNSCEEVKKLIDLVKVAFEKNTCVGFDF